MAEDGYRKENRHSSKEPSSIRHTVKIQNFIGCSIVKQVNINGQVKSMYVQPIVITLSSIQTVLTTIIVCAQTWMCLTTEGEGIQNS